MRFVFLSALEDLEEQIQPGLRVDGILTKPVDFNVILAMARKQIGGPRDVAARRAGLKMEIET